MSRGKRCIHLVFITTLIISMVYGLSINYESRAMDTSGKSSDDEFVIMNSAGVPKVVEVNTTPQKEKVETYSVTEGTGSKEKVVGEYDTMGEALDEYSDEVRVNKKAINLYADSMLRATSASQNNHIVRFKTQAQYGKSTLSYTEVETGRTGYLSTNMSNDAAYISTDSDGKIICKLSGVIMKIPAAAVKEIVSYTGGNISYYMAKSGKLYHYFSYINGSSVAMSSTLVGYKPSYLTENKKYYSYDGHYFYSSFANMIKDYQQYSSHTYPNAINKSQPYYNYYQYLSLRARSSFTSTQLNNRIKAVKGTASKMYNTGSAFKSAQSTYGINMSLIFGIACNESAYGTSSIAKSKNNIFGLNAVDSSPSQSANYFSSISQCISEFADHWMSKGYLNGTDSRYRGPHLGDKQSGINVKYASDVYWGEKAASQSYYLEGVSDDYQNFPIGISTITELSLYKETDTAHRIYTSGATGSGKAAYMYDYPVSILGYINDSSKVKWYKVQSDMPLKTDRSARNVTGRYNFARDYVYTKASQIKLVKGTVKPIVNSVGIASLSVSDIPDYTYTGSAIKPNVTIKKDGTTLKKDTDYILSYANNINAGTASITITGKGNYTGSVKKTFTIKKRSLSSVTVSSIVSQPYIGSAIKPSVTVKYSSKTLKKGIDYNVSYSNNTKIGTAKITLTGTGNFTGTKTQSFKIVQGSLAYATYSTISNKSYTAKAIKPAITIKQGSYTLKNGIDYTLSYTSNTLPGKAKITIKGKGNFTGTKYRYFYIVPRKVTLKSYSSPAKSKINFAWYKTKVTGYRLAYKQKGTSTWKYIMTTSTSKTLSRLKSKKYYYIKVRGYKTISGKRYYGAYSTMKLIKAK